MRLSRYRGQDKRGPTWDIWPSRMTGHQEDATTACRILLIEDDAPVRVRLARIIGEWPGGKLVGACGTLADAIQVIENIPIDLLVTDLRLPDGHGGRSVLRERQPNAEAWDSVPADDRTVIRAIGRGATATARTATGRHRAVDQRAAGRPLRFLDHRPHIVRRLGGHEPQPSASRPTAVGGN